MVRWNKIIIQFAGIISIFLFTFVLINPTSVHAAEGDLHSEQNTNVPSPVQAYHDAAGNIQIVAIDLETVETYFENSSLEYYAYMDIHSADPELIPVILEARNRIIFTHSWTDDEIDGRILDEDGTVIEPVPYFHDVFPSDWEVPCFPSNSDEHPIYHYG